MPAARVKLSAWMTSGLVTLTGAYAIAADGRLHNANRDLRVIVVDLSQPATPSGAVAGKATTATAWRTSFGSERRSDTAALAPSGVHEADIVLLQGVADVSALRHWLPARTFKLLVPRAVLPTAEGGTTRHPENPEGTHPHATLAIALRYRPGLRFLERIDFANQARPHAGQPPAFSERPARDQALAARVAWNGQPLWLASVSFTADCQSAGTACEIARAYQAWIEEQRSQSAAIIAGGTLGTVASSAGPPSACSKTAIMVNALNSKNEAAIIAARKGSDGFCRADYTLRR